jgi:transposase
LLQILTVWLDLAKKVFQVHGADATGKEVVRKMLRRDQVLAFFSQLPSVHGADWGTKH